MLVYPGEASPSLRLFQEGPAKFFPVGGNILLYFSPISKFALYFYN